MSPHRAVFLTGRREVRERLRSRAFRVGLLVQMLIVAGIAIVSSCRSSRPDSILAMSRISLMTARRWRPLSCTSWA